MDLPDSSPVIELIESFRRSKAMFAATSLGVFDLLERKPADLTTLAAELCLETGPLERLLGACVGLKVVRCRGGCWPDGGAR